MTGRIDGGVAELGRLEIVVANADISNAVLFFASDGSRYVTGVQLPVDAGCLLK